MIDSIHNASANKEKVKQDEMLRDIGQTFSKKKECSMIPMGSYDPSYDVVNKCSHTCCDREHFGTYR